MAERKRHLNGLSKNLHTGTQPPAIQVLSAAHRYAAVVAVAERLGCDDTLAREVVNDALMAIREDPTSPAAITVEQCHADWTTLFETCERGWGEYLRHMSDVQMSIAAERNALKAAARAYVEADGSEGTYDARAMLSARLDLYAALGRPLTDGLREYAEALAREATDA